MTTLWMKDWLRSLRVKVRTNPSDPNHLRKGRLLDGPYYRIGFRNYEQTFVKPDQFEYLDRPPHAPYPDKVWLLTNERSPSFVSIPPTAVWDCEGAEAYLDSARAVGYTVHGPFFREYGLTNNFE